MRTHAPTTRVNRRNPHLARLDRQIKLHGEDIELIGKVGVATVTNNHVNIRGIVKTFGIQQLIGNVSQYLYVVLISPNDLRRTKFRSGILAATAGVGTPIGHRPHADYTLPKAGTDSLFFRSTSKSISRVDAVYDGNECVRVEITVQG
jgi:hypothetical protein